MCILLELDYAGFGVSNLFFSKVIEEKPFGSTTLVKEGLRVWKNKNFVSECQQNVREPHIREFV